MRLLMENKPKALILALTCVLSWAFIPVVARFGQHTLDNYQFLFWSSLLSFIVLLVSTVVSGKHFQFAKYNRKDVAIAFGLGFMGAFLYYLLLYFAYAHSTGLEVLTLQYTWPIFIVIFSLLILKEKLTKNIILATGMGFLGVLLVLTKGNFEQIHLGNVQTNLLVLIAAAVFGMFSVLSKKANLEPFTATTIFFASATIWSLLAMERWSSFLFPTTTSLIPLLINGVFINGLSYILWLKALSYAKASFVAQLVFLTPVLAALLIVIFFHETFTPIYLVGMCFVVGAGIIAQNSLN